jgi:hypothetical protein
MVAAAAVVVEHLSRASMLLLHLVEHIQYKSAQVQSQEQEVLEIFLVDVGWLVIHQSPLRQPAGPALLENLQLRGVVVL